MLRADAIFLIYSALTTEVGPTGKLTADLFSPRGDAEAYRKVRTAWSRVGFRKLQHAVLWRPIPEDHGQAARNRIAGLEAKLRTPTGLAWWRRRAARQTTAESSN